MRTFESGATRDSEDDKVDYEGFLSPQALAYYGEYMRKHSVQRDGKLRSSDNWQKGIPLSVYMKSAWRHFVDWWTWHRKLQAGPLQEDEFVLLEEAICAVIFNAQGYLHELLKAKARETRWRS